jgi:hypothetical protein
MEPVFDGLVLLRRQTPLTRRLLVYFASGAYTDEDGELQGPGTSKSKQAYFDQGNLFLQDPTAFRYAVVWRYDFQTGLLALNLACPKQYDEQKPWHNPECHFYLPFQHAALDVTASEQFTSPDAGEDLELKPKRKIQESGDDQHDD